MQLDRRQMLTGLVGSAVALGLPGAALAQAFKGSGRIFAGFPAGGTLDAFVNPNERVSATWGEKIVDYAGAALILTETGGALCDQAGRSLGYPLDLAHRLCLQAAASPTLLDELMAARSACQEPAEGGYSPS